MSLYTALLRPLLFQLDAERAHDAVLAVAERAGRSGPGRRLLGRPAVDDPRLSVQVAGLHFPHPVGMAAGFDKSGRIVQALAAMGFSHVEVGSVSAHPSAGNPRPRLFRLPQDEAVVVNYGVPNDGALVVAERLARSPIDVPLGVNLVETNTGRPREPDAVVEEFLDAARRLTPVADYLTLNLNCPNTDGGVSPFDDLARLDALLQGLAAAQITPPVFLKFTAHCDATRADALLELATPRPQVAGFIFNMPPGKDYPLRTPARLVDPLPGTLCGAPTRQMMDDTLAFWAARIDRARFALVGSGGISTGADAYRKIRLGANLLQLYTALIYRGPGVIRRIGEQLLASLDRDGFASIDEAVGVDVQRSNAG